MKKKVIAYLHTHWDREWYREFEVFRLRLLRVFDNVIELLEKDEIPSFYFDGQVGALLDYLEIRPEKEKLIRKFIAEKKLFIGPCYCLIDEFLTDRKSFEKNLEIGLKISKEFGCTDFIGYLADTFGHSKNIPVIFKKYGINKCVVWRGCGDFPSEFIFNGINTVNLIRGYFMDIFSAPISIEQKAQWLKGNLDKIAEKSSDVLLLPIGADHLGIETDIKEQIKKVNELLEDYDIELSNPFKYFELTENNFKQFEWNDELRDNSKTFILPGCYSSRTKIKQMNVKASYLLDLADNIQKQYGCKYSAVIDYAYKMLLKNQAHDGICGCSTDAVHRENLIRYEKIIQIANTIIEELKLNNPELLNRIRISGIPFDSTEILEGYDVISSKCGFDTSLLHDTQRIPVTEDYTDIYTLKHKPDKIADIKLQLIENKLFANDVEIEFVRYIDNGDTYNYGPIADDKGEKAEIYNIAKSTGYHIINTSFFDIKVTYGENLVNFTIDWENKLKNHLWQVKFNLKNPVTKTYSEDMNSIITREFDPYYDMREHLPQERGIETKSNFAPMQRYVGAQGFGIITKGLTEYEVKENALLITLLRSTGVISNPKNPARSTPAGPPLETPEAQQLGLNTAEFSIGFFESENYLKYINEVYPTI